MKQHSSLPLCLFLAAYHIFDSEDGGNVSVRSIGNNSLQGVLMTIALMLTAAKVSNPT
jgi:hypothetical protein